MSALLYSVTEELLIEAHEEGEPPAMLPMGFILVLLLEVS